MTPITWVETSWAGFYGLAFMRQRRQPTGLAAVLVFNAANSDRGRVSKCQVLAPIRFEARIFRHNAGRGDTGARHIRDKVHNAILMAYLVGELNRFATKREPIE